MSEEEIVTVSTVDHSLIEIAINGVVSTFRARDIVLVAHEDDVIRISHAEDTGLPDSFIDMDTAESARRAYGLIQGAMGEAVK